MHSAKIYEPTPGRYYLQVKEFDEEGEIIHEIPLGAIASWRELLGIDDPVEVVKAILHVVENGDPDPCPITGRNVWTDPYTLLIEREEARERAALLAQEEGASGEALIQVATTAAYDKVHQPINGGECVMDRCRRDARAELGLPDPPRKCGAESRTEGVELPARPMTAFGPMTQQDTDQTVLVDALTGWEGELLKCTQQFLHGLSGHDRDPITPIEDPPLPPSARELMDYYQKEGQ